MKIILLEDLKGKGKKDDIIDVKDGYGNFLITAKKAKKATEDNLKELDEKRKIEAEEDKKNRILANNLKLSMEVTNIIVFQKIKCINPETQTYKAVGKITSEDIVSQINTKFNTNFTHKDVIKSDLTPGLNKVKIRIYKDIFAEVGVQVIQRA